MANRIIFQVDKVQNLKIKKSYGTSYNAALILYCILTLMHAAIAKEHNFLEFVRLIISDLRNPIEYLIEILSSKKIRKSTKRRLDWKAEYEILLRKYSVKDKAFTN